MDLRRELTWSIRAAMIMLICGLLKQCNVYQMYSVDGGAETSSKQVALVLHWHAVQLGRRRELTGTPEGTNSRRSFGRCRWSSHWSQEVVLSSIESRKRALRLSLMKRPPSTARRRWEADEDHNSPTYE